MTRDVYRLGADLQAISKGTALASTAYRKELLYELSYMLEYKLV
jgi:hypothetical protein